MRHVLILCFILQFTLPAKLLANWLCPSNLQTYATEEECKTFCGGVSCIESGTYMCSADTDGDGEIELYQCQQVQVCPLGDYPCNDGQCSIQGTCIETSQLVCSVTVDSVSPSKSCTTSPGGFCSIPHINANLTSLVTLTFYFRGDCAIYRVVRTYENSGESKELALLYTGNSEDVLFPGQCYKFYVIEYYHFCNTSTSITNYNCSLNNQTYSDLQDCQKYCIQSASCSSQWKCPVAGGSECQDLGDPANYQDDTPTDFSYYQDDGSTDASGNCLGQILIFNGRPMMCRRSGVQTGFHNCCDADDEIVNDMKTSISQLGGTFAVVSKLKDAISLASDTYKAYQALSAGVSPIEVASNFDWSTTAINSAIDAFKTGKSVTDAMSSALQALGITPTGIIANIAINFAMDYAMKILLGGCKEDDIITAAYNELGLCHYVGTKCVKKYPVIGCVQKANIYCCFNSKLARIIHEQGRSQLQGDLGGWGSTDYPNCRGFTPEEFQMLDFSRIDLSEWYGDIETRTQQEIQQNLQQNINNFQQNIR